MNIILGLIIAAVGVGLVMKTEWLMQNFGRIAWFEAKLGAEGGSRLGYKLLGLIAIFIGLLVMTGLIGSFMGWALGPLIRGRI
jgi:fatty acid desaturase